MSTKIEWTDETWNPVTGCTKVSRGCAHCYAERMARRLAGRFGYPEAPNHFDVTLQPDRLEEPLHWRKPRRVFVCSMSDLFHDDVPKDFIWRVIEMGWRAKQHIFQILTKRPERMLDVLTHSMWWVNDTPQNIWLGVSAENQKAADERIPLLLQCPAAVRLVSIEPMLERIDLRHIQKSNLVEIDALTGNHGVKRPLSGKSNAKLDWVIVGGESGPGARPMHPDWVRDIRDQCNDWGVSFFLKQRGEWLPIARASDDWRTDQPSQFCAFGGLVFHRVGKKRAGRLLDGREWNEMPQELI